MSGAILSVALDVLLALAIAWAWYGAGRRAERRKMREENGWWAGFRAGLEQQKRTIQADLLERGIVLNFNEAPKTKRN